MAKKVRKTPPTGDLLKEQNRRLFKDERVAQAHAAYIRKLEELLDDEKGREMLHRQQNFIDGEIKRLEERHKSLSADDTEEEEALVLTEKANIDRQLKNLRAAKNEMISRGDEILSELQKQARQALEKFKDPENRIVSAAGKLDIKKIEKLYHNSSRKNTDIRYQLTDFWYATANERAIEEPDSTERAIKIAQIPFEVRHAKWRLLLTIADALYGINLDDADPKYIDDNNTELLSHLLVRLSDHDRGATAEHMPRTRKRRHNPAIHSLHVVELVDKVFHNAKKSMSDQNKFDNDGLMRKWQEMRNEAMLAALLHDMGELDGELSVAEDRKNWNEEQIKKFEELRSAREEQTFINYLEEKRDLLRSVEYDAAGRARLTDKPITDKPITDEEFKVMKNKYLKAFDLAEEKSFLGVMLKGLERIQTTHDFLRFNGHGGAKRIDEVGSDTQRFTRNYASFVLRDAAADAQEGTFSLKYYISTSTTDKVEKFIYGHLHAAIMQEYEYLQQWLDKSLNREGAVAAAARS